jgi:hypothetical protein
VALGGTAGVMQALKTTRKLGGGKSRAGGNRSLGIVEGSPRYIVMFTIRRRKKVCEGHNPYRSGGLYGEVAIVTMALEAEMDTRGKTLPVESTHLRGEWVQPWVYLR